MSGGLDSAGVAAIAARAGGATAYSAVFPETPTVDESDFISAISEAVGIAVVREPVPVQSMLDGAVAFPAEWRLPLRPQNMYAWQPLLRRAADDGATAVLDGEGGDLLFMARRELIADSLRALRPARAVRLARALPGNRPRGGTRLVLREWGLRMALPAAWHESTYAQRRNLAALPPWLQGRDPQALAVDASWEWKRFDGPRWWARLADALCGGLQAVGIRDHLRRRAAMSGLEAISPFFDVDLVELVLRLPPELAFDQALTRPVQRDAMEGLLPDAVRLRAGKSYFDELFQRSFGVRDLDAVRSLLAAPDAEIGAFVDLRAVREDIVDQHPARHPRGVRYWMNSAWRLSTMECWLRQEADGKFAARRLAGREDSSSVVQSGASA
jgi:asparagine synthase (glutamine-hydrolysing)